MDCVLGLDVGGTNLRIAQIKIKKKPVIVKQVNYLTKDVKNIINIINKFDKKCDAACIGFAGPIVGNKAALTNAELKIDLSELKKKTNLKDITLINDFHAVGYGVPFLEKKDFLVLNKGTGFNNKVQMVVGPGTGLGKAYIINNKVYPCEGGLTVVGIEDIEDYALLDYLKGKYKGQVYYEDIISGRGLIDIYDHLEIKSNLEVNLKIRKLIKAEPVNKAKLITKYSKEDKLCDMTLRIFTKFYARFVRDSALNLISSKVYLVGGISEAIKPYLKKFFIKEFLKHRKYTALLKKVNLSVIINTDVGLIGTGAVAGKLV
ncbi:ROK family protein [Candidatus Woesearchaeota archaeon]|nr:ROK family protein [Candidatus Woesearchaeota archaeon]